MPELSIYEIGVTGKESENDMALRVEVLKGTSVAKPGTVATPGTAAQPTTLYIVGALFLIGIIAVVVIKRKEIFK